MSLIYDRIDLVRVLDNECFGAASVSAALIGGHKVGKTRLLQHIHERENRPEAFYCLLNVSMMEAQGGLTDESFLRYFVEELSKQVDAWIDEQAQDENRWRAQLAAARAADQPDTITALERRLDDLRR